MTRFFLLMSMLTVIPLLSMEQQPAAPDGEIKLLENNQILDQQDFIARCRLEEFAKYPYLYEGSAEREAEYIHWFASKETAVVAVAYVDQAPVGFLSGISVEQFDEHFAGTANGFREKDINPTTALYMPEGIITQEYRGLKIMRALFEKLSAYAQKKKFTHLCFVDEEHETHPLKPDNYRSLRTMWEHFGFKAMGLIGYCEWMTKQADGTRANQTHELTYWIKRIVD